MLLIFSTGASSATNMLLFVLDEPNEGFHSTDAPLPGQTGNYGDTLGRQRMNVFYAATDYWEKKVESDISIRINIKFDPLDCDAGGAILGAAGPNSVYKDFNNAPKANTWYVEAVANSLAGRDIERVSHDIGATFNSDIDNNNNCLNNVNWWYGIDSPAPSGTISFYDTVLHEIGHGLGFLSLVNGSTGAKFQGLNDAYMRNLYDLSTSSSWPGMSNAQRASSAVNTTNLVWKGTNANSNASHLSAGIKNGRIRMYAPNPYQAGSSVSHWDTALSPNELMEPFATTTSDDTLTIQLLKDIGWRINEGPGEVGFATTSFSAVESHPSVRINVTRRNGNEGSVSLDVITSDGSAFAGLDYTAINKSLSWVDGEIGTKSVTIPILADMVDEPSGESFAVNIVNFIGDATQFRSSATVNIRDPDTEDFLLQTVPAILAAVKQPDEPVPPPPTVFPRWSVANDVCCPTSSANFTVTRGSDSRNSNSASCSSGSAQSSEANGTIGSNTFGFSLASSGCGTVTGGFSTIFRESTRYLFVAVLDGSSIGIDLYSAPFSVANLENETEAPQGSEGMTLEESVSIPLEANHSFQSKPASFQIAD